jgi:hypothetical protein
VPGWPRFLFAVPSASFPAPFFPSLGALGPLSAPAGGENALSPGHVKKMMLLETNR